MTLVWTRTLCASLPAGKPAVHFACTSVISMATRSSSKPVPGTYLWLIPLPLTFVQPARFVAGDATPVAVAQLAQLTLLSRTAALAILEAALKQMHVCVSALYYIMMWIISPIHQRTFFAGRTSLSCLLASSCCLLLACWWCRLLAGAYQYWRTGACVLGPTCIDLGLAHRSAL